MIVFSEFCARRALGRDIEIAYQLLPQIGVNPDEYIPYLMEHPELWQKNQTQVLNELNPFSAGWAGVQGAWNAATGQSKAAQLAKAKKFLQGMNDIQLQQRGISAEDRDKYVQEIEDMRSKAAEAGEQNIGGGFGKGWQDNIQAQRNAKLIAQQDKLFDQIQRKLGIGPYSPEAQQKQPTLNPSPEAQQKQPTLNPSPEAQQKQPTLDPQAVQQVQGAMQQLNQAVQAMLGAQH